eukprot:1155333-Pelagomonas_calceolata.AAC.3
MKTGSVVELEIKDNRPSMRQYGCVKVKVQFNNNLAVEGEGKGAFAALERLQGKASNLGDLEPERCLLTSKNFGEISSMDFAEPGSSSLVPSMAACSVKVDADSPRRRPDKQRARRWPIRAWPDLPALMRLSVLWKHRQAPGALATTQNHMQYYQ